MILQHGLFGLTVEIFQPIRILNKDKNVHRYAVRREKKDLERQRERKRERGEGRERGRERKKI